MGQAAYQTDIILAGTRCHVSCVDSLRRMLDRSKVAEMPYRIGGEAMSEKSIKGCVHSSDHTSHRAHILGFVIINGKEQGQGAIGYYRTDGRRC
jgi:hypothetical protein